jgi:PhnB protein
VSVVYKEETVKTNKYIRHGMGTVRPYLFGSLDTPEFVTKVFEAQELERSESGGGFHVELKIGDSVVVLETGNEEFTASATRSAVYVYVEDVDVTYQRAIQAGATALSAPKDKPYQERSAGVKDPFGNTWWLSTYKD